MPDAIQVESRDGSVRGEWEGDTLRLALPRGPYGVPEFAERHVKGVREILAAITETRRKLGADA